MTTRESRTRAGAPVSVFGVGPYAAGMGPALPFFARDGGVSLDTAGLVVTAIFGGSIVTSFAVATRLHGCDPRLLALIGLVLIAAVNLGIGAFGDWAAILVSALALLASSRLVSSQPRALATESAAS